MIDHWITKNGRRLPLKLKTQTLDVWTWLAAKRCTEQTIKGSVRIWAREYPHPSWARSLEARAL